MPSEVNQFLREACPANNGVVGKFRCHGTSAIYPALSRRITCRTDNTVEAPLVFWFIPALATPKEITPSDCNLCVILQPTATHTHEPNLESAQHRAPQMQENPSFWKSGQWKSPSPTNCPLAHLHGIKQRVHLSGIPPLSAIRIFGTWNVISTLVVPSCRKQLGRQVVLHNC
jgi:hypothetical protein